MKKCFYSPILSPFSSLRWCDALVMSFAGEISSKVNCYVVLIHDADIKSYTNVFFHQSSNNNVDETRKPIILLIRRNRFLFAPCIPFLSTFSSNFFSFLVFSLLLSSLDITFPSQTARTFFLDAIKPYKHKSFLSSFSVALFFFAQRRK